MKQYQRAALTLSLLIIVSGWEAHRLRQFPTPREVAEGKVTGCLVNLEGIAVAMEFYAIDWDGRYPQNLGQLTPRYMRELPRCPAAGYTTYRADFGANSTTHSEHNYLAECTGEHHKPADLAANFPAYSSMEGPVRRRPYTHHNLSHAP